MTTIIERSTSDDAAAYGILIGVLVVAIMLVAFLLFGLPWSREVTTTEVLVPTQPPVTERIDVYVPPQPPDINIITTPERTPTTTTTPTPTTPAPTEPAPMTSPEPNY